MSNSSTKSIIDLTWLENEDLVISFNDDNIDDLVIRKPTIPSVEGGSEARKILAASLAKCMSSTLYHLLKFNNIEFRNFKANAEAITEQDTKGTIYVNSIDLTISLSIPPDDATRRKFQRIKRIFDRGCLLSRSLKKGLKINTKVLI